LRLAVQHIKPCRFQRNLPRKVPAYAIRRPPWPRHPSAFG